MGSTWEEVKRLAADFQHAQLCSTNQKLSERNCIEIVNKLTELNLLTVVYTTDGKEYITPEQLVREIQDELFIQGGRINLADLTQTLKVDFSQVEAKASDLASTNSQLHLLLGQLIDRDYLDKLGEEVNEKLQQEGQISIGDLTKVYDLPGNFLQEQIERRMGSIIQGHQDGYDTQLIYTEAFVARNKARIRGVLSAVTKPTPVASILAHYGFHSKLFFSVVENFIATKTLSGSLSGGRIAATYTPTIYSKCQTDWVDSFYRQNGYLEYDALFRLGLSDAKNFIKKRFKTESVIFLPTCCVAQPIIDQVEAAVDEALMLGTWVDLVPLLPSILSTNDTQQLISEVLKIRKQKQMTHSAHIFCDSIVVSEVLLQTILMPFDTLLQQKAEKDVSSGAYIQAQVDSKSMQKSKHMDAEQAKKDKKEERRKKALGGKGGGGMQGRETKTKSSKKRGRDRAGGDSDSDEEMSHASSRSGKQNSPSELTFMSPDELINILRNEHNFQDSPEDLVTEIATHIHGPLTKKYQETLQSVFQTSMVSAVESRRKKHADLQEKMNVLLGNVRQFEKGIKQLPGKDVQTRLYKHLLKTICTDIVSDIILYLAQEHMVTLDQNKDMTSDARLKLLKELPDETQEPLMNLHKSLNESSIDDFIKYLEAACSSAVCDMVIRKPDKKKERQLVFTHRQMLIEQIAGTLDPALLLHLAVLILFSTFTQCIIHASGKFVPQIIAFLKDHVPQDSFSILYTFQGLVMKQLTITEEDEELKEVKLHLEELTPKVKEIAITTKRGSLSVAGDAE